MYAITDIEWIEDQSETKYLTQIAAIRVNENWEIQDTFSRLISPPQLDEVIWEHMAFNGYDAEDFIRADEESYVLKEFSQWLQEGEIILLWHNESKNRLKKRWETHDIGALSHKIKTLCTRVISHLSLPRDSSFRLYNIARDQGIDEFFLEHCAEDDATVMHQLMQKISLSWDDLNNTPDSTSDTPALPDIKKPETLADRNRKILEKSAFQFVFAPGSDIFHLKSCSRILNAKTIQGTIYYKTALQKRRPCKICNPSESDSTPNPEKLRFATFFDGRAMWIKNKDILGYCHSTIHPGVISKDLLKQHNCIRKNCQKLQKYEECPFWTELEKKKAKEEAVKKNKDAIKEKKKAKIAKAREEEQELINLRDTFQSYVEYTEEYMEIVRVEKVKAKVYKIYYVSDNRFADSYYFPDLVGCIQSMNPGWKILLRHIRDVDGHFVTIDEFHARKRA